MISDVSDEVQVSICLAVSCLASLGAAFATGQILHGDGGWIVDH